MPLKTELRSTEDDMYEVCVEEDGIRACGFVSSMHLVDPKVVQLTKSIRDEFRRVYLERHGIYAD